jgi:hypothetical protein
MNNAAWIGILLGAVGCDAHVVDAVREPPMMREPVPVSPLESSLIHRYSFDGEGTTAVDSKFAAHGLVLGTKLSGTGALALAGGRSGEYVDLPNRIVSGLHDATFEAWLTWNGTGTAGGVWQRIFDFGNSSQGEDVPAGGTSYLFLTTASAKDTGRGLPPAIRLVYSDNGVDAEQICQGPAPFPIGMATHVAVVIDATAETMSIFQDGALLSECPLAQPLSAIDDVNNWLGHSNFSADDDLAGSYDEFRIYAAALTAAELKSSFKAGPDAKP